MDSALVNVAHHFKSSQRKVAESSSIKHFVLLQKIVDIDLVVHHYWLIPLYVAQGGHVEHHAGQVVRVAAHLE